MAKGGNQLQGKWSGHHQKKKKLNFFKQHFPPCLKFFDFIALHLIFAVNFTLPTNNGNIASLRMLIW